MFALRQCIRGGEGRDNGPEPEVSEDLLDHRRLLDKKAVNRRAAVLEQDKARDERRAQVRFGFLRARTRMIERDVLLHAVTDIFKLGQKIEIVFAAERVIHAEILIYHRFWSYDEKVEGGEFCLREIERVLGARDSLADCFEK